MDRVEIVDCGASWRGPLIYRWILPKGGGPFLIQLNRDDPNLNPYANLFSPETAAEREVIAISKGCHFIVSGKVGHESFH